MSMYFCKNCDQLMDDDYSPMAEGELCPDCFLEKEEAENERR